MQKKLDKKETILITGIDLESPNRGVVALSYGIINYLYHDNKSRKILIWKLRNKKPIYENSKVEIDKNLIEISTYNTNQFQTWYLLILSFLIKIYPDFIKKSFLKKNYFLSILNNVDAIVDLSEGDSFSDLYGLKRMLAFSFAKIIPINLGIPVFMFPQTIGPFRSLICKVLAKWILNKVERIYVREPQSEKLVFEIVKKKDKVIPSFDLGFLLLPKEIRQEPLIKKVIKANVSVGINISGLIYDYNQRKNILRKEFDYVQMNITAIIRLVKLNHSLAIFLVPNVYSTDKELKKIKYDDLQAIYQIYNQLPHNIKKKVFILEKDYSCAELNWFISNLSFFIGTRMHPCIFAISNCVPTAFIAYSYKSIGMVKRFDLEECALDMRFLDEEQIVQRTLDIFRNRFYIKKKLTKVIPPIKENILKGFNLS